MARRLHIPGALSYFAAWLQPWQPVFRARASSGLTFFAHRRDAIGRHIAKYGSHEPALTRWIAQRLSASPGLFVDAGANIGWHSLHAVQIAGVAAVAFEPDPFNAWLLDRNLAANGVENVTVIAAALGSARGTLRLHRYKDANLGRHSAVADHGFGSRTVPLVDLDGALADLGLTNTPVSVLKIDVEGYEPAVIAGAAHTLKRTAVVALEYSPALSRAGPLSVEDMLTVLAGAGLAPFTLAADGTLTPVDAIALPNATEQIDLIWVRRETAKS
jgi:FkbM family methyltransferase